MTAASIRSRPLAAFFVLAFGITWAVWVPRAAGVPVGAAGQLWTWVPAVAALITAALVGGRAAVAELGARLVRWRVGWRWYAVVVLGPAAFSLAVAALYALLGGSWAEAAPPLLSGETSLVLLPVLLAVLLLTDGLGEEVGLGGGARARMSWIGTAHSSKVPVSVAATGPKTIATGARHAERVDFTVGADPRRVSWAVGEARRAAPGGKDAPSLGAFVNFAVNDDAAVARDMVRGSAAIFAHYASEGPLDVLPAEDRGVVERVGEAYDERAHGLSDAGHAALLPDDFLDRFTVVGEAETCAGRLRELLALGLERVVMVPGSRDADPALVAESNERLAKEVLPALRG